MDRKEQEVFDQETQDEAAVSRLVGELKHVEAPANFERRVMSRIANGEPAKRPFATMPILAYAASLILVLLLGSFLVYRSYRQPVQSEPTQAVNLQPAADRPSEPSNPVVTDARTPNEPALAQNDGDSAQRNDSGRQRPPLAPVLTNSSQKRGPHSSEFTLRQPRIIRQQGFGNPNVGSANRNDVNADALIPVASILDQIGITSEYANGWRVGGVSSNGAAHRSGVEVGDVIIALDDRDISSVTELQGPVSVNSLKIRRAGSVKTLKLKP